jgi:hypothetical protein
MGTIVLRTSAIAMTQHTSDWLDASHAATDRPIIVDVGARRLIAIDGVGGPRGSDYRLASETLKAGLRDLRSRIAHGRQLTWRAAVLETAWWTHPELPAEDIPPAFEDRSAWHWQQMVEVPEGAEDQDVQAAIAATRQAAGRSEALMRTITLTEGRAAQMLHVGGSSSIVATLRALFDLLAASGLRPHGHIHELRIADEADVPADRARSILRVPIESGGP